MDITDICVECKNFFLKNGTDDIYPGTYTISGGMISQLPDNIINGQYIRIVGSKLNDRVIKYDIAGMSELTDETFNGSIWDMSVPVNFVKLCEDIGDWISKNESADSAAMSPFSSESFGGYSYSKGSGSSSTGGAATVWQDVFRPRLNSYRRINVL